MRAVVNFPGRSWSGLALLGVLAVAGCSSDTGRFGNPNASPYATRTAAPAAETTGTVQAAPTSRIASQPLPPPPNAARPATVAPVGVSGGGGGMGSYGQPAAAPAPAPVHASLPPPPPPAPREVTGSVAREPHPQWNWDGGTAIVAGAGETAETLASKYGVPAGAILQANGLRSSAEIRPGQRLVIPKFNLASNAAPAPVAVQPAPHRYAPPPPTAATAGARANVHVVARGETLMSISRRYHKPVAQIAAANNIAPQAHLKIGDRIFIPGRVAESRAVAPPVPAAPKVAPPHAQAPAPRPVVTAEAAPAARVADAGPRATAVAAPTAVKAPAFTWPVRGRVIAAFGGLPNGQRNDGIDLAVPVGTDIHAAEDGIVAYAGHELKGYGNLILIRHEKTGFVTAYANTGDILVKRNDHVSRGQVIARSGQSGGVAVPQLHFEIRKGSTPVDPSQYLPTGT
jgi:murein DD-endopeptidase MepM/ murein hydrolase activator NlpD